MQHRKEWFCDYQEDSWNNRRKNSVISSVAIVITHRWRLLSVARLNTWQSYDIVARYWTVGTKVLSLLRHGRSIRRASEPVGKREAWQACKEAIQYRYCAGNSIRGTKRFYRETVGVSEMEAEKNNERRLLSRFRAAARWVPFSAFHYVRTYVRELPVSFWGRFD